MNRCAHLAVVTLLALTLSMSATTQRAIAGAIILHPDLAAGSSWGANGWAGGVSSGPGSISLFPSKGTPGTYMWIKSFKLPSTVNLDNITVFANWSNGRQGTLPFGIRLCQYGFWEVGPAAGCVASNGVDVLETPGNTDWSNNHTVSRDRAYICGVNNALNYPLAHCAGLQFEIALSGANAGGATLSNARVQLSDNTPPTTSSGEADSSLESSQWIRGTKLAKSIVKDKDGIGLASSRLHVDGLAGPAQSYSCDLGQWIPCPSTGTHSSTVDTSTYEDGPHNGFFSVTDAVANVGRSADFAFKTDNTKPHTPSELAPQTDGSDGWSASNSFGAEWKNAEEDEETSDQSGISKVVVDINPTTGSQLDPAPQTIPVNTLVGGIFATRSSVSGLTVPSSGEWSLRISLIDKAGNVSAVGDGTGSAPDSDIEIGLDPNPPLAPTAASNGWLSRDELGYGLRQRWTQPHSDDGASPVCGYSQSISETEIDAPDDTIDVAAPATELELPHDLPEGSHWIHLRSVSCAGVASTESENAEAKVDRTDPIGAYSGVEDGRWYQDGQNLELTGTDELSGMEPAPAGDPLDGNGAFFKYSINGGGSTDTPGGHSSILTVNGEGAKNLSFSPVDLAGNTASPTSVKFGIDATRPSGHFEPQDPDRPTLIRAPLTDAASGIENAWLQIRNLKSTAAWTLLPTSVASFTGDQEERRPKFAIASARFPDTKLPMGTFEARLITVDQAGNQLITTRDRSGDRFFIDNPMRDEVNLTAAIFRGGHRCKAKRARKCIRKRKGSIYLQGGESSARVGYRRAGIVRGFLTTGNYSPLAREPLEVYTREPGKPEVLAGTTSARADGSFYFRLKPGVNRKVRIYYPGTDHLEDADAGVSLGTAARMSLRVNRHHARTGQSIQFIGRAKSFDGAYPASRKIIALQFYTGGKWRPAIAIARTDKRGRFSIEYRFDRIPPNVKARIKFRVMAPAELGWNHVTSASKRVIVTVN